MEQPQEDITKYAFSAPSSVKSMHTIGMRWFHFLVYFLLWALALDNLVLGVCGVLCFFPALSARLAALLPFLNDYFYSTQVLHANAYLLVKGCIGVLQLAFVPFLVVTALRLLRLQKSAPRFAVLVFAIECGLNVLVSLSDFLIGGFTSLNLFSAAVTILPTALLVWANVVYFKNRAFLFVRDP